MRKIKKNKPDYIFIFPDKYVSSLDSWSAFIYFYKLRNSKIKLVIPITFIGNFLADKKALTIIKRCNIELIIFYKINSFFSLNPRKIPFNLYWILKFIKFIKFDELSKPFKINLIDLCNKKKFIFKNIVLLSNLNPSENINLCPSLSSLNRINFIHLVKEYSDIFYGFTNETIFEKDYFITDKTYFVTTSNNQIKHLEKIGYSNFLYGPLIKNSNYYEKLFSKELNNFKLKNKKNNYIVFTTRKANNTFYPKKSIVKAYKRAKKISLLYGIRLLISEHPKQSKTIFKVPNIIQNYYWRITKKPFEITDTPFELICKDAKFSLSIGTSLNLYPVYNNKPLFELVEPLYSEKTNIKEIRGCIDKKNKRLRIGYAIHGIGEYLEDENKLYDENLKEKIFSQKNNLNLYIHFDELRNQDPVLSLVEDIEKIF